MADRFVDWRLAGAVAATLARGEHPDSWASNSAGARRICDGALERVLAYTQLRPSAPVPAAELIDRQAWIDANVAGMRELTAPVEQRAVAELSLPWPLGGVVRGALGAAAGAEAGVAIGYAARRVLGQYQVPLTPAAPAPRMLLIGSNLSQSALELGAEHERFLLWVAIHEQTHSVQFAAVPWLRDHLAGLLARLIAAASDGLDLGALAARARRVVAKDPRKALREALRGELVRALAGPAQAALIDELQATMAVVEGYAEHVMDAAADDDPVLARMRASLDERRARRGGLADTIARALGMGMKLRQYELGKRFGDTVAADGGIAAFNRVWESPEALPSLAELKAPDRWLRRVNTAFSRPGA